jgi:hypothetical protein
MNGRIRIFDELVDADMYVGYDGSLMGSIDALPNY